MLSGGTNDWKYFFMTTAEKHDFETTTYMSFPPPTIK
jgi:hypothetical protein